MDMTGGYAKSVREHASQAEIVIDNYHVVALATKALDEVRREHWNELRHTGETGAAKAFKDARWSLLKNPEDLTDRQAATLAALQTAGGKVPRAWAHKETVREIFKPGLTVAFHSARAALALILLACGPITLTLPHDRFVVDLHLRSSMESLISSASNFVGAPEPWMSRKPTISCCDAGSRATASRSCSTVSRARIRSCGHASGGAAHCCGNLGSSIGRNRSLALDLRLPSSTSAENGSWRCSRCARVLARLVRIR